MLTVKVSHSRNLKVTVKTFLDLDLDRLRFFKHQIKREGLVFKFSNSQILNIEVKRTTVRNEVLKWELKKPLSSFKCRIVNTKGVSNK